MISWAVLCLWRMHTATNLYNLVRRVTLHEIGQQWGEGEWTAKDLWR